MAIGGKQNAPDVNVYGSDGTILDNAMLKFNSESIGDIMSYAKNMITLATPNITVSADGYKQKELTLNILDNSLLDIDVVLEKGELSWHKLKSM